MTIQNKLLSYSNCNVSTDTKIAKVSVTGELFVYKQRAWSDQQWSCLSGTIRTSVTSGVSFTGFTGNWNTIARNPQFQTWGISVAENIYAYGEKPFLQGFNLARIHFVFLFHPLQYTEILVDFLKLPAKSSSWVLRDGFFPQNQILVLQHLVWCIITGM